MECIALEKDAYNMIIERIARLKKRVNDLYPSEENRIKEGWIENAELVRRLNVSLRTLQSYRERGVIGFTMIGRKVYYKIAEVQELLEKNRISGNQLN